MEISHRIPLAGAGPSLNFVTQFSLWFLGRVLMVSIEHAYVGPARNFVSHCKMVLAFDVEIVSLPMRHFAKFQKPHDPTKSSLASQSCTLSQDRFLAVQGGPNTRRIAWRKGRRTLCRTDQEALQQRNVWRICNDTVVQIPPLSFDVFWASMTTFRATQATETNAGSLVLVA